MGQNVQAVTVEGKRAYVAAGLDGLYVLDIANPAQLRILDHYPMFGFALNVAVSNETVYVANYYGGLYVLHYTVSD